MTSVRDHIKEENTNEGKKANLYHDTVVEVVARTMLPII